MFENTLQSLDKLKLVKNDIAPIPEMPSRFDKKRIQSGKINRNMVNKSADFSKLFADKSTND